MAGTPSVMNNTPWWVPGVTVAGAGAGVLVTRCNPFGFEDGGPRHLEGGFYGLEHLGPHVWHCQARADLHVRTRCPHNHVGKPVWMCNGHVMMFRKRMGGVCPPCAHPPREIAIQAAMNDVRNGAYGLLTQAELDRAASRLWDLQHELDELVERGIVHRCGVVLEEIS